MSGRIGMLSALLGVQLLIIAAVLFVEGSGGAERPGPFLAFEADSVDEIRISGAEGEEVVISRTGDDWTLGDGLPADAARIDEALADLAGLGAPFPVATSAGARQRFEVTEDDHQRRVVLLGGGDELAEVYLGTSPGYQQVHARRSGDDAVYSVGLSNYQLPVETDQWLDKALLQPHGEVQTLARRGGWRLERGEEGWLVDGEAADSQAAEDLVRRFADLRVMGIASAPDEDAAPAAAFEIGDDEGSYTLSLYGNGEGEPYVVASDRRDGHFELASYQAEQMLVELDALLPDGDGSEEPTEAGAAAELEGDGTAEGAGDDRAGSGDERAPEGEDAAGS